MSNESRLRYAPEFHADGSRLSYEVVLNASTGKLSVETSSGMTFNRYNGHEIVIDLENDDNDVWDADVLDALLESEAALELVKKILGGYESNWDGRNMIGGFNADAVGDEIEQLQADNFAGGYGGFAGELEGPIRSSEKLPTGAGYWAADDYLSQVSASSYDITASTTDEQLEEIAAGIEAAAIDDLHLLDNRDVLNTLKRWRDRLDDDGS